MLYCWMWTGYAGRVVGSAGTGRVQSQSQTPGLPHRRRRHSADVGGSGRLWHPASGPPEEDHAGHQARQGHPGRQVRGRSRSRNTRLLVRLLLLRHPRSVHQRLQRGVAVVVGHQRRPPRDEHLPPVPFLALRHSPRCHAPQLLAPVTAAAATVCLSAAAAADLSPATSTTAATTDLLSIPAANVQTRCCCHSGNWV